MSETGYYDQSYPPSLWTPEPPPPDPTLVSINPLTAVEGDAPFTLTATGLNFTADSTLYINAIAFATTHLSATQLQTQYNPAVVGVFPVIVRTVLLVTGSRALSVTAAAEEPPEPPPEEPPPEDLPEAP